MRRSLPWILLLCGTGVARAQAPDADAILKRAMERQTLGFDRARMVLTMKLRNRRGEVKVRRIASRTVRKDGMLWQHVCFLEPDEVKNTALLSLQRKGSRDDQYLWLPGQGRLRRISVSQRGGSFMGSDFTYRDLEPREVGEFVNRNIGEESIGGHACWVIESVPKPGVDDPYGRVVAWVRKRDEFPIRTKFYDREGRHVKTLFVREVAQSGEQLYARRMRMFDLRKRHSTYLTVEELETGVSHPDEIFTPAYLGRGQECRP